MTCAICGLFWRWWVDGCPDCKVNVPAQEEQ